MKHENRKPGTRKGFAALVALVLILCVTIGGTIAWITDQTSAVTNTFTPATVSTEIDENVDNGEKSNITVINPNTQTNIPVYIRATVVANWVDENDATKIVAGPAVALPATLGNGWTTGTDGYYYYTIVVDPGESTSALFKDSIKEENAPAGARLQVTILAEAIQAQGGAVQNAWPGAPITNS